MILIVMTPFFLSADEGSHDLSVDDVLGEIRAEQGVNLNREIDPEEVSDPLLEKLGEAYMNLMVPDERQHEWMDRMMGGEDSESLEAMHRMMGYRYLTGGGFRGREYRGMMGGMPMMGGYGYYGGGMHPFLFQWWWWPLIVLILAGVVTVIVAVFRRGKHAGPAPLEILKARLAKGEITKEEFDALKQDIL